MEEPGAETDHGDVAGLDAGRGVFCTSRTQLLGGSRTLTLDGFLGWAVALALLAVLPQLLKLSMHSGQFEPRSAGMLAT